MSHYHQLIILFFLGFSGWSLFVYTLLSALCNRAREMQIIKEIDKELKKAREDLNSLK
jgi:hypothetical protein